jgi:hypothetical protein
MKTQIEENEEQTHSQQQQAESQEDEEKEQQLETQPENNQPDAEQNQEQQHEEQQTDDQQFQDIEENTQEAEHLYQIPWFNWPTNDQFIPKNNDEDESNRFRTKANDIQQAIINIFNEQHEPLSQFQQPFRNIITPLTTTTIDHYRDYYYRVLRPTMDEFSLDHRSWYEEQGAMEVWLSTTYLALILDSNNHDNSNTNKTTHTARTTRTYTQAQLVTTIFSDMQLHGRLLL